MKTVLPLAGSAVLLLAGVASATDGAGAAGTAKFLPMEHALHADAASSGIPPQHRIYDWLLGSWTARVVDYADDGSKRESRGEWHFGYVLEGRAIQDVWISPPRSQRNADTPKAGNRYGTSIRSYDPAGGRWHVVWINPVSGAIDRLVARRVGRDIVQEGRDDAGNPMRWVFTDIEDDSARWYAERSRDDGRTWQLEAEFFLRREDAAPAPR
jgi:hypothetical protein